MRSGLKALALAGAVVMLGETPSAGEQASHQARTKSNIVSLTLNQDEALILGQRALTFGKPELAVRIAEQILAENPRSADAYLLGAAAAMQLGDLKKAQAGGRLAFWRAKNPTARFQAAILSATALSAQDRPVAAKLWLRLASMAQPTYADQQMLHQAFANLDQRTPLKFSLQTNFGPSSNINDGSRHSTFLGFIPIAVALPGTSANVVGRVSYEIKNTPKSTLQIYGQLQRREVFLSARSQKSPSAAPAWAYASTGLALGLKGQIGINPTTQFSHDAQVTVSSSASGQNQRQRLQFGIAHLLSPTQLAEVELTLEGTEYDYSPKSNTVRASLDASLEQTLGRGKLRYSFGLETVNAAPNSIGIIYDAASLGLSWQAAPNAASIGYGVFADMQLRDYWKTEGFNSDFHLSAGASARFGNVSLMGFAPSVSFSANRVISEVAPRDTFGLNATLSFSSSF
jgi:hypothetical protein